MDAFIVLEMHVDEIRNFFRQQKHMIIVDFTSIKKTRSIEITTYTVKLNLSA